MTFNTIVKGETVVTMETTGITIFRLETIVTAEIIVGRAY